MSGLVAYRHAAAHQESEQFQRAQEAFPDRIRSWFAARHALESTKLRRTLWTTLLGLSVRRWRHLHTVRARCRATSQASRGEQRAWDRRQGWLPSLYRAFCPGGSFLEFSVEPSEQTSPRYNLGVRVVNDATFETEPIAGSGASPRAERYNTWRAPFSYHETCHDLFARCIWIQGVESIPNSRRTLLRPERCFGSVI